MNKIKIQSMNLGVSETINASAVEERKIPHLKNTMKREHPDKTECGTFTALAQYLVFILLAEKSQFKRNYWPTPTVHVCSNEGK